ncbi:MAG TPA: DUF1800 domain-containing protein [Planctomycetaceae bacterium]|nr:DUF1800 domain-containing protein [Planctomycetaceae bacterium]
MVHLHRRAGFAAIWREIERDLADGPQASVERILRGEARGEGISDDFTRLADVIGDAAAGSSMPDRLKAWWLYRMLFTPDPLSERLALLWHNHFATSNLKVRDLQAMRRQNELFRRHGRGLFGELLTAVLHDPALLVWLDADSNRKGYANENLARELMELFTLGIGHYAEADVKAAARALTGWSVVSGGFRVREELHDDGEKTILGQTGRWNGDDLVRIVLEHPATARRLAVRLCGEFLGEGVVGDAHIEALAAGLREHDLDIGWAVETILRSELFFSEANLRSRVISPAEFVVGAVRALELFAPPPSTLVLAEWTARLGQDLFYPPNVGGWNGGRQWLTAAGIIGRANFAAALVEGRLTAPPQPPDVAALAGRHGRGGAAEDVVAFLAGLLSGGEPRDGWIEEIVGDANNGGSPESLRRAEALVLASPEVQLG